MDEFCSQKKVFFNDQDRISYSVKKSRGLFNEFRGTMHRSFKNMKQFDDHPDLHLLNLDWKLQENVTPGSRAKSLKELSKKTDNSEIMVVCPTPIDIGPLNEYHNKNKQKMQNEFNNL